MPAKSQESRWGDSGLRTRSPSVLVQEQLDIPGQEEKVSQPFLSLFALLGLHQTRRGPPRAEGRCPLGY